MSGAPPVSEAPCIRAPHVGSPLSVRSPPCQDSHCVRTPPVPGAPRVRIPAVSGLPPCREPLLPAAPAKGERENIGREGVGGLLCHRHPRVKTSRDTAPQQPLRTGCSLAGAADLRKPRHLSGLWVEPGGWGAMGPTRLCGVRRQVTRDDLCECSPRSPGEPEGAETLAMTRVATCPDCQDSLG